MISGAAGTGDPCHHFHQGARQPTLSLCTAQQESGISQQSLHFWVQRWDPHFLSNNCVEGKVKNAQGIQWSIWDRSTLVAICTWEE